MLVCVDGSGPFRDATYNAAMADSFVRRIWSTSKLRGAKLYYRGPDSGGLVSNMARPAVIIRRDLTHRIRAGDRTIVLIGYSRGAAIMINTAALLHDREIEVEAMFLFDAVDRSLELSRTGLIPANVKTVYHAVRDPRTGSRTSFGNCGLRAESGVVYGDGGPQRFFTTHAGMGGVPWGQAGMLDPSLRRTIEFGLHDRAGRQRMLNTIPITEGTFGSETAVTPTQEQRGMDRVQHWMWGHLRRHGVVPG